MLPDKPPAVSRSASVSGGRGLQVARTRVVIPVGSGQLLPRPRLRARLDELAHRRAFAVVAPAGFGKSTLLAAWAADRLSAWYTVAEADDDEFTFVAHLLASLRGALSNVGWLQEAEALLRADRWRAVLDIAINGLLDARPLALIVDDAHQVRVPAPLDYLLRYAPATTCVVLGARSIPALAAWDALAVRGDAAVLGADELALDQDEVAALCVDRPVDATVLRESTGGWPIAVDFLLRTHAQSGAISNERSRNRPLDAFLGSEIWNYLSSEDREFLLRCSVLDTLSAATCSAVSGFTDALDRLRRLHADGVFLQAWTDDTWRIHALFRDYLRDRLSADAELHSESHRRAADRVPDALDAIAHLLAAGDGEVAARRLVMEAPRLLAQGRHERLLALLDAVEGSPGAPREADNAELILQRGHALRHKGAYEEAAVTFSNLAEKTAAPTLRSEAMIGLARVYLDTLQPRKALNVLRAAWRGATDSSTRAVVLEMMAENSVNQGRSRAALRFRRWARTLVAHRADALDVRLLLRTGQLQAARTLIIQDIADSHVADAHRENSIMLAYIAALEGDSDTAERAARQGLAVAREHASTQTEAVALTRLGHALQLRNDRDAAMDAYDQALTVAARLGVERLRAEALLGLALVYAAADDVPRAYASATEALSITRAAGDEWFTAWTRLACGIAGLRGGHPDAAAIVREARSGFVACGDSLGIAVSDLWLGEGTLPHEYAFLTERRTLFGPHEVWGHSTVPEIASVEFRGQSSVPKLTTEAGLLRVQSLGTLRVWRQGTEVAPRDWKREKARELFLILLTRRGNAVHKEQLMDLLWPDADADAANRDFRVALHALSQALDPDRPKNAPARWLERRGSAYLLRNDDQLALDADELERLVEAANQTDDAARAAEYWRRAIALFHGDYLEEFPYSDWAQDERERLRVLFFATCERLARHGLGADPEEAVQVAHAMLARDRGSEEAWRLLISAHLALGRDFLARRAYEQCVQTLQDELGVTPSAATRALLG